MKRTSRQLRRARDGGIVMPTIKVLAFETGGIPRMLSSESEIAQAIERKDIVAGTGVTLYLDNGERRFGCAENHPELADRFRVAEPPAQAPARPEPTPPPVEAAVLAAEGKETSPWRATPSASVLARSGGGAVIGSGEGHDEPRPVSVARLRSPLSARSAEHAGSRSDSIWFWMFEPYRRYADFQGRSRRKEYWSFLLLVICVTVLLRLVFGNGRDSGAPLLTLFYLATVIPALAVHVRRFHDLGASGWWLLLNLLPYVGSIIVLIAMLFDGTRGANRFGAAPNDRTGASIQV